MNSPTEPKPRRGIRFAVVGDDRADDVVDTDACFVGDQGGFAVDRCRGGVDPGAQGVEGGHFVVGQVAILRSGEVGQTAGLFDQGGLASLKLAQLLAHVVLQSKNPHEAGSMGVKKPPGGGGGGGRRAGRFRAGRRSTKALP
jgi:hypothetical protein